MFNVQLAASKIIQQVLLDGRNLNQQLDPVLQQSHWLAGQKAALQDLCYGSLRFYRQLDFILAQLLHKPVKERQVQGLLLVALYQLIYSKNASHAVVDHAVRAAEKIHPKFKGLVNACLRNFLRQQSNLLAQSQQQLAIALSYPDWWLTQLQQQYGGATSDILLAGNTHPPMTLRLNLNKVHVNAYLALLMERGMSARVLSDTALLLDEPVSVDKLPHFYDGWVSVQDAGAQRAALLLDVADGMRVLDACAAPGGKTAHILECASLELVAVDKSANRLARVADNLQRLQLKAELKVGDASSPQDWWNGQLFDRILADVPCSASGVVRRHPDIKWLRRPEDIAGFAEQQLTILNALWPLLRVGGKLLYATCSIFAEENHLLLQRFALQHGDAKSVLVDGDGQLLPTAEHDGFFYGLLQKVAA